MKAEVRTVWFLAWQELRSRYAATLLGPLWPTVVALVTASALGLVYASIFSLPLGDYLPYLFASLVSWNFISSNILESPGAFTASKSLLLNTTLPLRDYAAAVATRNAIVLVQTIPVALLVSLLLLDTPNVNLALLFLTVPLLVVQFSSFAYVLGLLGVRLPDFGVILPSLLFIVFLATPVLWPPSVLGERQWLVRWNPVYWWLEGLRGPLLGYSPSPVTWVAIGASIGLGLAIAFWLSKTYGRRVKLWL